MLEIHTSYGLSDTFFQLKRFSKDEIYYEIFRKLNFYCTLYFQFIYDYNILKNKKSSI